MSYSYRVSEFYSPTDGVVIQKFDPNVVLAGVNDGVEVGADDITEHSEVSAS